MNCGDINHDISKTGDLSYIDALGRYLEGEDTTSINQHYMYYMSQHGGVKH